MRFQAKVILKSKLKVMQTLNVIALSIILMGNLGDQALSQTKTPLRGSSAVIKKPIIKKKKPLARKPATPKAVKPAVIEQNLSPDLMAALTPITIRPSTLEEPRGPYIEEAPVDDLSRVAWCRGALEGHMELAKHVSTLTPYDENLMMIGTAYVRAYDSALSLSIEGQTENGQAKINEARNLGRGQWELAFQATLKSSAWAYDTWQLPGDCEHAAIRVSGRENLFSEMATDKEIKIINDTLANNGPTALTTILPEPKIKAETAPTDPEAPVSSNTAQKVKRAVIPPNT